jgi:uncharacterized Ntn-hydrolase superfamily protein
VGVIVVGKGAAQAQSWIDPGQNRLTMANGLLAGLTAQQILDELKLTDPELEMHQYGIAELMGGSATFTGIWNGLHASGVTGQAGSVVYAIQGNVLTGADVVLRAEEALIYTEGDLGQKIMAAMHGAKEMGGDGRCSCHNGSPTVCGCPPSLPPPNFKGNKDKLGKSAHCAYLALARIGDTDGVFNPGDGFANGSYYLDIEVVSTPVNIDPVDRLQKRYKKWRKGLKGRADHILTEKVIYPDRIIADGISEAELLIAVVDVDGKRITHGNAAITVTHAAESAGATVIGPVEDYGDGTYSVPLAATQAAGTDLFCVEVTDAYGPILHPVVTLYPFPVLEVDAPSLVADVSTISAGAGDAVDFDLRGGAALAGRDYMVLGTASGVDPGYWIRHIHVPLNPDLFSRSLSNWIMTGLFPSGAGQLDLKGEASALFDPAPGLLLPFVGMDLHFAWTTGGPVDFASNPVQIEFVP